MILPKQMNFRKTFALVVALIMVTAVVARFLFPMQLYRFAQGVELWRGGVREFKADGVSGLIRDECDAQDPEARGCTCVALLHGLGDDPQTWKKILVAPKKSWRSPVRLYALDLPHNQRFTAGDSPASYRVRIQAELIARALSPVCRSWVVVGNSMGAWEAEWLALDGRLKIEKLLLVDAAGPRSVAKTEAPRLFGNPTIENMKELVSKLYFEQHHYPDLFWKKVSEMMTAANLNEVMKAQTDEDFTDGRLSSIRVPTMVLWGAADRLLPDSIGHEVQSQIPSSIWREIPECGHLPQKECPIPVIQAINDMMAAGSM